jgi:hypothetical protein
MNYASGAMEVAGKESTITDNNGRWSRIPLERGMGESTGVRGHMRGGTSFEDLVMLLRQG